MKINPVIIVIGVVACFWGVAVVGAWIHRGDKSIIENIHAAGLREGEYNAEKGIEFSSLLIPRRTFIVFDRNGKKLAALQYRMRWSDLLILSIND